MPKIPATAAVINRPYGGYALTRVRRAGGEETVRFEATLCLDGRPLAYVSNGGEGGSHRWSPIVLDGWDGIDAFNRFAGVWNADDELAGIEDGDQLVNRLLTVEQMNRARSLPFLLDGENFWQTGEHSAFRSATREQALETLASPAFAGRNPRVWSREHGDFVPLA